LLGNGKGVPGWLGIPDEFPIGPIPGPNGQTTREKRHRQNEEIGRVRQWKLKSPPGWGKLPATHSPHCPGFFPGKAVQGQRRIIGRAEIAKIGGMTKGITKEVNGQPLCKKRQDFPL